MDTRRGMVSCTKRVPILKRLITPRLQKRSVRVPNCTDKFAIKYERDLAGVLHGTRIKYHSLMDLYRESQQGVRIIWTQKPPRITVSVGHIM